MFVVLFLRENWAKKKDAYFGLTVWGLNTPIFVSFRGRGKKWVIEGLAALFIMTSLITSLRDENNDKVK